jgi:hypothetical protein
MMQELFSKFRELVNRALWLVTRPWYREQARRKATELEALARYWTSVNCPRSAADAQAQADMYREKYESYVK